ncbi:CGNR zinc finger domain-containing protein [Sciscionella sediminilitoris]|uniref:CGNR zinc finger domain-containing protein n=1 Tax=Sciscionella sediminilitoris TaxID=1445613 RepID=UPI0018D07E59|nr:CGNR zinc finger domain-containing protein [Sciscionella sp. SE31]
MTSEQLRFDTGRACLDLLATVGSRLGEHPVERLDGPERLRAWFTGTGLLPADQPIAIGPDWLAEAKRVRTLLHRIVQDTVHGRAVPASRVRALNELAGQTPPIPRLRTDARALRLREPVTLPALLSLLARDAIDLLSGDERQYLRECEGGDCDLVYLDHSRGRRRRWCSSRVCGNRERVANYRERLG